MVNLFSINARVARVVINPVYRISLMESPLKSNDNLHIAKRR